LLLGFLNNYFFSSAELSPGAALFVKRGDQSINLRKCLKIGRIGFLVKKDANPERRFLILGPKMDNFALITLALDIHHMKPLTVLFMYAK
jgi:hypothetical protein